MIKGLTQMFSGEGIPEGFAFYAKNIIISEKLNAVINEKGTQIVSAFTDVTNVAFVNGIIILGSKIIIFYMPNETTHNIGVYDEISDVFTNKVSRSDLGYDINYPISGRAKLNSKGELVVAFTDGNDAAKYINLDTAQFSDNIDLYNLFLSSENPNLDVSILEGSGSFKTGCFFVATRYLDRNKCTTNWSQISDPTYIVLHDVKATSRDTQGTDAGIISSKALKVNISNLNLSFNRVQIAVISSINGVVEAKIYKEVSIHNSGTVSDPYMNVIITGSEVTETIGIEEILSPNQIYSKVQRIGSLNDQLFLADLTLEEVTDFQTLANAIRINWTSIFCSDVKSQILGDGLSLVEDGNDQKIFMHDEVYAMYVRFERTKGQFTDWFHIPGRTLSSTHRSNSTNPNGIKLNGNTPKKYQLEDTATLLGTAPVPGSVLGNIYSYGQMGVWENEDETYPDNFPDFAGEKVRHHRFPSQRWLHLSVYNTTTQGPNYMRSAWDRLGIRVEVTTIPASLQNKFIGIQIGYAKRDLDNKTVLGYDILQYAANPENGALTFDTNTFESAAGNWKLQGDGAGNNDILANKNYVRLHSPDVLYNRPALSNAYISCQRFMKSTNLNNVYTENTELGRILYGQSGVDDMYSYITNYYRDVGGFAAEDFVIPTDYFVKLENPIYVAANSQVSHPYGTIYNLFSEECVFAKLYKTVSTKIATTPEVGVDYTTGAFATVGQRTSPGLQEQTMLITIKAIKSNIFVGYRDQQVVPIGTIIKIDIGDSQIPTTIFRQDGDTFICFHSFLATSRYVNNVLDGTKGLRNIKAFLCASRLNLQQRYITQGDLNTYFYPAAGYTTLSTLTEYWFAKLDITNAPVNKIVYSKSFNVLNDLEQYGIYDHETEYNTELPFAIARSQKASRETSFEDGWRIFKPNDIFYTVRDRGKIINIVGWGTDSLIIHHENSLYRTRDKAILQSDIGNISLGSGDIFALEPEDVQPSEYGYGGTQHRYSCLLCEAGYIFGDAQRGEFFIYKGGNTFANLGKGFSNLFKAYLKAPEDNPLNLSGIATAFDSKNYRIIVLVKNGDQSFTTSFDLRKEEWSSFHDYKGDLIFNTRTNLYSFKDKLLYKHGYGPVGNFYGTIYPSFVDLVINTEPTKEKILAAINWITEVIDSTGATKTHETITSVTIWNDRYCTGVIDLVNEKVSLFDESNNKQTDGTWHLNTGILDKVRSIDVAFIDDLFADYRPIPGNIETDFAWFDESPLRGKYFIVRLEYSNFEDKAVYLKGFDALIKPSHR